MKTNPFRQMLAVVAALIMLAAGCNKPAKETPATAEELSQVNRDFMAAINAKDVAAAASPNPDGTTITYAISAKRWVRIRTSP